MREINIKVTEVLLADYNITVDALADVNGYPSRVVNTAYQPAVGEPNIPNPDYVAPVYQTDENGMPVVGENGEAVVITPAVGEQEIPNPDYVPAVGEQEIDNPESRTEFLAKRILENGIQPLIKRALDAKRQEATQALRNVDALEKNILLDIVNRAEIVVVE